MTEVTRADFLRGSAAFATCSVAGLARAAGETREAPMEIAPGVFVHKGQHALFNPENAGDIANATFIVGNNAVAVVDTGGSARCGALLRDEIRKVTNLPVRYVINTHMHPDHVFGNAAFIADKPVFAGHFKLARALAARQETYLALNRERLGDAAFQGTRIIFPGLEVKERLTLDLGGRTLTLEARPTAHTDNDLTVFDNQTRTFILADLLFAEHVPTLDGSIRGWLALLDGLRTVPAARAVPGHGPAAMAWPEAISNEQRYLERVAAGVRAAIKAGRSIADAGQTVAVEEKDAWQLFGEYHTRNVTAAFAELEWE